MNILQEVPETLAVHSRVQELSSLRLDVLRARRTLWRRAVMGAASVVRQENPVDAIHLIPWDHEWDVDEPMTRRAFAKLHRVETVLEQMCESSYGICRECKCDIPVSQLRARPQALLCAICIERRLEELSGDAL